MIRIDVVIVGAVVLVLLALLLPGLINLIGGL